MRLIRAVANFPNVIYVLCYDQKLLAASLEIVLGVKDGKIFLEKVVQVSFKVPRPEAFDLRQWFSEECVAFYSYFSKKQMTDEQSERLRSVCAMEGSFLTTPRDVVRTLNAIKLYWPPISNKADYPDLVWLQLVKLQDIELYSWIERYLIECTAKHDGASISRTERTEFFRQLDNLVNKDQVDHARTLWRLKEFIPGIQIGNDVKDKNRLFNLDDAEIVASLERGCRLGSPEYSRFYFAFSMPEGSLDDGELYSFVSLAASGKSLEWRAQALIQQERPQGGTKFGVLLDRLTKLDEQKLPDGAIPSILMVLANSMDENEFRATDKEWGVRWTWDSGARLFWKLFSRLKRMERKSVLLEMFGSGKAIGWLMCELIRKENFSHGRYGDRPKSSEDWILSDEELDEAIRLLLDRFKSTDRDRIIYSPEVLNLMYGWQQAGDKEGVLEWVGEQIETDSGLLRLLSRCRSQLFSDKMYFPLKRKSLDQFMDFDDALARLKEISENEKSTTEEIALAMELLDAANIKTID